MKIKLNANRINQTQTTGFLHFSEVVNRNFRCVDLATVNVNGNVGVLFHLQNDAQD